MRRISAVMVLVGGAWVAQAVTLQQLTMEDMTDKATAIILGKVVEAYGARQGSVIYTHYRVQVQDQWKGSKQSVVDVMLPGGAAGGYRQAYPGVPQLATGRQYLMYLWAGKSGGTQLLGLSQGLFNVTGGELAGDRIVSRPATSEMMLDAKGKVVQDRSVSMSLTEMNRHVVLRLASTGGVN